MITSMAVVTNLFAPRSFYVAFAAKMAIITNDLPIAIRSFAFMDFCIAFTAKMAVVANTLFFEI
jgi:hypothetical protein